MADDLKDIGQEDIFPLPMNWQRSPANLFIITRYLHQFAGTSSSISELNPETPISFEGLFTIFNKTDEHSLLDFMHSRKGRIIRFWIPYQKEMFTLVDPASIGSGAINCEENGAVISYQGYERIYIKMKSGDMLTRWVTGITQDFNKIALTLDTPLDRDIGLDDYFEIGRFLLVRFDSDKFEFEVSTNNIFDFSQRFVELVKEYSELAPNV